MFFGQLFLVLLCTVVIQVKPSSEALKLFYFIPFVLIGIALFMAGNLLYQELFLGIYILNLMVMLLQLALAIHCLMQKEKNRLTAYLGLFTLSVFLGLWLLFGELSLESLLLMVLGYFLCALYVYQNTLKPLFAEHQQNSEALKQMNAHVQMEVIRRVEEVERSNRKLVEISKMDSMTGIYMKTAVMKNLESILERSPQATLSVLMVDIDHFKQINDSMGHQIGDRCIKTLTSLAQSCFRKDDILGRFGGDEFLILLPATLPARAFLIADRFRQQIQNKTAPPITISVGIASYPEDAGTAAALIEAADKALYHSKQNGRDQVTLYSSLKED